MYASRVNLAKLNHLDIEHLLDRRIAQNKRGTLTSGEVKLLVQEIHDRLQEDKLQQGTVDAEMSVMQQKIQRYNVERLGDIPTVREDGTIRILVSQMGGCASAEVGEIKIAATERLIQKYDINLCLFMKLNFNWSKVNSSANLASCFTKKEREMRCVMEHNIAEMDALFEKHQPGGTGMLGRHEYLQYAAKPSVDLRGLGRRCSWPFFCNPTHVTRIADAYRPCASKVERLKTGYQQHVQYIQLRGLPYNPVELFGHD
jgi:hypothetical protein